MKLKTLLLATLFAMPVFAAEDCDDNTPKQLKEVAKVVRQVEEDNCPVSETLRDDLCESIGNFGKLETPMGKYRYRYQKVLIDSACIKDINNNEEVSEKIGKLWNKAESKLTCNSMQLDVDHGSAIKLAVSLKFDAFMFDISRWKVNLNKVDSADNRTVLDYIKMQIERNKGNSLEPKLQGYYDRLKKAGAKHRDEL